MKSKLVLLFLLIVGISLAIIYRDQFDAQTLETWIESAGVAGPLLFMVIYAVGTVFFLPGSVLTLAGGALFGPYWGTCYNLTAATVGAIFSFLIARYLASDWVEQRTGGRLKQLKQGVEGEGWHFVAFVRLVPLFPFNLLNYALGLTRIKFTHYAIATYICMLPGAVAYTYLGFVGREAAGGGEDLIQKVMMALALLAIAAFIPRLIGRLRQKPMMSVAELKQRLDAGEDQLLLDVRSAEDFVGEKGHIAGAINLPLEEMESRREELSDYMERTVTIVCTTDRRSSKAAQKLTKDGFTDVHVVKGGMTDWTQNGYPTA